MRRAIASTPRLQRFRVVKRILGFTLLELMVVLAITVILALIAAPAMSSLIASQRLRAMASDLYLALEKTRSEAVKRNASVTLAYRSGGWTSGWQILDPADPTTNPALEVWPASGSAMVTTSPGSLAQVVFNPNGRLSARSSISFVFSNSATTDVRCVSVDTGGRPYAKAGGTC